jgi:hypothetical protein
VADLVEHAFISGFTSVLLHALTVVFVVMLVAWSFRFAAEEISNSLLYIVNRWRSSRLRHMERKLEIMSQPAVLPLRPYLKCQHLRSVPVLSEGDDVGKLEAWLCTDCDQQLPPDWAVRAASLPARD